jgi:hypothetical protein
MVGRKQFVINMKRIAVIYNKTKDSESGAKKWKIILPA